MNSIAREKKLAQRIIQKHSLTPPIDVVSILKQYADYVEDYLPNEVDAICIMTKKPLVVVEKLQPLNRKRFTLAHELGHIIMPWHHGMISCHTDTKDNINENEYQKMEREANSFAAELLMPSTWLKDIIYQYEKDGIEKIVGVVSTKAEVSRSAAFYSIIAQLPRGYYITIDYSGDGYLSIKKSPGTEIYIPQQNYLSKVNWLNYISVESANFVLDGLNINYWKVENDLSDENLSNEISMQGEIDLEEVIQKILKNKVGTFPSIFFKLIRSLPPGFIFLVVKDKHTEEHRSTGTRVVVPKRIGKEDLIFWLNKHQAKWGTFSIMDYEFYWAQFVIQNPSALGSVDKRISNDILKNILKDSYSIEVARKYQHKINGVVGALNSMAEKTDEFEDYYRKFRERFVDTTYEKITAHPLFESFIVNKINEMMARKR